MDTQNNSQQTDVSKTTQNNRKVPAPLGLSSKKAPSTGDGYDSAKKYVDKFFKLRDYPLFDELTDEDVEGEHLAHYMENFFHWLATNNHEYKPGMYLMPSGKETKYYQTISIFQDKFKEHNLWKNDDWKKSTHYWFMKKCRREDIVDPDIEQERKSIPLYKDLSKSRTLIRQMYIGNGVNKAVVDLKSITMAMISEGSAESCHSLAELNLVVTGIGRGGEHVFLRWGETAFDEYFHALDLDWPIIKQSDRKCILVFCDRDLYCCCVFFALGCFFLQGGLRREGVNESCHDFIFPGLHKLRADSVASRLTANMQKYIKKDHGEAVAKQYTTRSARKGKMTENRANRDLSIQHELMRSGHTPQGHNPNAEGYVQTTPAMSAPGGRAAAGYSDPHADCLPYSFECLGEYAVPQVLKLIELLFVIDVPQLQYCASSAERGEKNKKGKLWELTLTVAARLIGSYNDLVKDLIAMRVSVDNHPIVYKIRSACQQAQITDSRVKVGGVHHWQAVLKYWSKAIKDDFVARNPPRASPTASIAQHLLCHSQQIDNIAASNNKLVEKVDEFEKNIESTVATLVESNNQLTKQVDVLTNEKERLVKENKKLARNNVILAMPYSSPATAASRPSYSSPPPPNKKQRSEEPPVDKPPPTSASSNVQPPAAAAAAAATAATTSVVEPPVATAATAAAATLPVPKPPTTNMNPPGSALALLSGVPLPEPDPSGVTIQIELERLCNGGIIKSKATSAVKAGTTLKKSALYDKNYHLKCGFNRNFTDGKKSEVPRYVLAMKVVAIAITNDQWKVLCDGEIDHPPSNPSMRRLTSAVSKQTMDLLTDLEIQHCDRKKAPTTAKPTLRAIADRFKKVWNNVKASGNKSDEDMKVWFNEKLGMSEGQQTMTSYMASNNTTPV